MSNEFENQGSSITCTNSFRQLLRGVEETCPINVGFKENSIVKGMQVIKDESVPDYIKAVVEKITTEKIDRLGKLLVYHCKLLEELEQPHQSQQSEPQPSTSGGATRKINRLTRRRKSVFKRKGKKSYRKKKYGKTKKSRRFRRSVRSRR